MRLTALDQRLEHKLKDLYLRHMERTRKIDWSYHTLIPWERGRNYISDPWAPEQVAISPELSIAVETALLTEVNLPWFTAGLGEVFRGSLEVIQDFIHTWTSEEDQHANVLETYLLVTRNTDPNRLHRLRKTVVRNGWTPGEASAFEGMAYTSIQELSTQAFYIRVAEAAEKEDPQLALILRTLAKDETLHYVFYRDAVKIHLEINPNYIWPLADVMVNFAMPGYLMPHFKERTYVIAEHTNYGIAEFYRQVIKVLADYWDLKNLHPTFPEAQQALDKLNKYLEWQARMAVIADKARAKGRKSIPIPANVLLGM